MNTKQIHESCITANVDYFETSKLIGLSDLGNEYHEFSLTDGDFEVTGPIIANFRENGKRKNYCATGCHSLIIGGTGSGKSQCYYRAQIEAYPKSKNKPSVFIMDLKGEYYRNYASLYRAAGYKVFVLNFKEPFESCRYNPLTPAWVCYQKSVEAKRLLQNADGSERTFNGQTFQTFEEWKHAVLLMQAEQREECENYLSRIAKIIVPVEGKKDPSWEYGARQMFYVQAIGLLEDSEYPERGMTAEKFTIANIIQIASCTEDDCEHIYNWMEMRDKTSIVNCLRNYYTKHARVTRDGFVSCFATKVDRWNTISTKWITSYTDLDVNQIVEDINGQKVAIFCITDETRPESYDLCMVFIDHLISALKIRTDKMGPIENDFHILADEFANMPELPNMSNRITTLRSYKIWLHMGIQSFDQLDEKYGEKCRNIIVDNCDVQVFFGTNNTKTAREFAASLGEKTAPITSYNIGNDGKLSLSITAANRPLVRHSDLASLKLGEAYVKVFRHSPVFTTLDAHFMCEDMYHDDIAPERVIADLSLLEKISYDIRSLPNEKPKRRYDWEI